MWGLLHPLLLNGEAGYYLTMLSSAVHVLKNMLQYLGDRANDSTTRLSQVRGAPGHSPRACACCFYNQSFLFFPFLS